MKKIIFLSLLFSNLNAQKGTDAVLSVLNKQVIAWNEGDLEGFMQGYWNNDSLKFISKNGITYGWKPVLENYKRTYSTRDKMGQLSFNALSIILLSNKSAFVTGNWRIDYSANEPFEGWFSLLFMKKGKTWVILVDHTS
ncbi:MAG: DUF4440 domain-containing protein [Bacteroidia bacterium]